MRHRDEEILRSKPDNTIVTSGNIGTALSYRLQPNMEPLLARPIVSEIVASLFGLIVSNINRRKPSARTIAIRYQYFAFNRVETLLSPLGNKYFASKLVEIASKLVEILLLSGQSLPRKGLPTESKAYCSGQYLPRKIPRPSRNPSLHGPIASEKKLQPKKTLLRTDKTLPRRNASNLQF